MLPITPSHSLLIPCVLCIAHSAFPFFNSFHQCIQEPVSKRAKLTTRSKAKLQVPSQFFFNVFIVARPAAQPFPILESQTIQKAKRQWFTSFNCFFCLSWQVGPTVAQQQPVVDAQQQPPAPAVAKNTQAIRHCYIVFIGHT